MSTEELKKKLMSGMVLIFAKQLNANHNVRSCYALVFDRRHGFHVVEKSLKHVRVTMENEGGILLFALKNDKLVPIQPFNGEPVTELAVELEEETYQKLPRRDFTVEVQERKLLKKIGFF